MSEKETIVALATPPGYGGVGILRLSGPAAYEIAQHLNGNIPLPPRQAVYSSFFSSENEHLDQGLMLYFKAPASFTGEDVVEIQGHGSPLILDELLKSCLRLGARMARPGEFSERAFLNQKMDLTQAEAVADLIHASSLTAARCALRSLQGEFSKKIEAINEKLIVLRLYIEAYLDFPEEDLDLLQKEKIEKQMVAVLKELELLEKEACQGVLLNEGANIVIIGEPNAGKSTLFNCFAKQDLAIVTDIAGTTRDVMRYPLKMDELSLHFIDTAGLRETEDRIEQEGIRRAWKEVQQANCVLLVMDVNSPYPTRLMNEVKTALDKDIPLITVYNKIDQSKLEPCLAEEGVYLSARLGLGFEYLKTAIKKALAYQPQEGLFLARRRHLDALALAKNYLFQGQTQIFPAYQGELLAEDLRLAHQALGEITGEFSSEDLLGRIFSQFCIGK